MNTKRTACIFLMSGSFATVLAQNTAVISQQSGVSATGHDVLVVQQGQDNTSVVNQSNRGMGNRAVIRQSGTGNVATIHQGNGLGDTLTQSGQSVHVTQSGAGETYIDQTDGQNTIRVRQRGPVTPPEPNRGERPGRKRPKE